MANRVLRAPIRDRESRGSGNDRLNSLALSGLTQSGYSSSHGLIDQDDPSDGEGRGDEMRLFVSAGEPSGDLHGANLIRAMRDRRPDVEVLGFGGDRMAAAGCNLAFPLCDYAVVGLGAVIKSIPTFYRILGMAREVFEKNRPDALVLIDYPGFHWWLAGLARKYGIPVSYFVPPQLWAWGGWRARKMRRLTDQVLCSLPFEEIWFGQRQVPARYVGHPYFDELSRQKLNGDFLREQQSRPGTIVGILPGSRYNELHGNMPSFLEAARIIHAKRPDIRYLVACLKDAHADCIRNQIKGLNLPLEIHAGKTPEIIHLAHSCLSVSGSVSLELLYRCRPATMVYHLIPLSYVIGKMLLNAKYITIPNLLADRLLYPEYIFTGKTIGNQLAEHVLGWLNDRAAYEKLCGELAALKAQIAIPGACARAALAIEQLASNGPMRRAA